MFHHHSLKIDGEVVILLEQRCWDVKEHSYMQQRRCSHLEEMNANRPEKKQASLYLNPDLFDLTKEFSHQKGIPFNTMVVLALEEYFARRIPKVRIASRR